MFVETALKYDFIILGIKIIAVPPLAELSLHENEVDSWQVYQRLYTPGMALNLTRLASPLLSVIIPN